MIETKSERQHRLLGRSFGSAFNRLRKSLLFELAKDAGLTVCHRCGKEINTLDEFSIEHKDAWERAADPVAAFFSRDNIAFSHLVCNSGAALRSNKRFKSKKESNAFWNSRRTREYEPEDRRMKYIRTGT